MPSRADLLFAAIALAGGAPALAQGRDVMPPEAGTPTGPRATAGGEAPGEEEWVGAAPVSPAIAGTDAVAIVVAHHTLPLGALAELTALDSGRVTLAIVERRPASGRAVELSPAAARALGADPAAAAVPLRLRPVLAAPGEAAALRAGQPVSRLDAPQGLLRGLRARLGQATPSTSAPAPRPAPTRRPPAALTPRPTPPAPTPRPAPPTPASIPAPAPVAAPAGRWEVQVGAFADAARAQAIARALGGRVVPLGRLSRVRLGPYATRAEAQRGRDGAARRGYAAATVRPAD